MKNPLKKLFLAIAILLLAENGFAAVTYLGSYLVTNQSQTSSSTVTIPSGATLCVLGVAYWNNGYDTSLLSITLDSQAGVAIDQGTWSQQAESLRTFYFTGFGTGNKTLAWNWSETNYDGVAYMLLFFKGNDYATPIRDHKTTQIAVSENVTLTTDAMNSSTDDILVALASGDTDRGSCTMDGGGQTSVYSSTYHTSDYGAAYKQGTGATDTATTVLSTGTLVGCTIKAAGAGVGYTRLGNMRTSGMTVK
jgi:hypothetical protein